MNIVDHVKDVAKLAQQFQNLDLYRKILDLQNEVTDLYFENRELKLQLEDVRRKVKLTSELHFEPRKGWYSDGRTAVPVCPTCWENTEKVIHLKKADHHSIEWICKICGWTADKESHHV